MAISCTSTISLAYAGDRNQNYQFASLPNPTSPDAEQVLGLSAGDNTITVPSGGTTGVVAQGAVIIPPTTNAAALTLKGNAGDTGVALNRKSPSLIGLDSGVLSFILNAGAPVVGVRVRIY